MMKYLFIIILFVFTCNVSAQHHSKKEEKINNILSAYKKGKITYEEVKNLHPIDPEYDTINLTLEGRFQFEIIYEKGSLQPSQDSSLFFLWPNLSKNYLLRAAITGLGEEYFIVSSNNEREDIYSPKVIINLDGAMVSYSHEYGYYVQKNKYILNESFLHEARQPYYYLGFHTFALFPLKGYSDEQMTVESFEISPGDRLELILTNDPDYCYGTNNESLDFLVKTQNDILCWVRLKANYLQVGEIKGFGSVCP